MITFFSLVAFLGGMTLFMTSYLILTVGGGLLSRIWCYIDEKAWKWDHDNILYDLIAPLFNYRKTPLGVSSYIHNVSGDGTDGMAFIFPICFGLGLSPLLLVLLIYQLGWVIFIVSIVVIMRLARFSRRTQKVLTRHIKDKSIHVG